jgi:4-hydroxybutyrate CoA-transferase
MALAQRAPELENVTLDLNWTGAGEVGLLAPGTEKAFKSFSLFPYGPTHMATINKRVEGHDFIPMHPSFVGTLGFGAHREDLRKNLLDYDVAMITITPPDSRGYVTFGSHLWYSRAMVRASKIVIGEVNDKLPIIPGGDNWMHIDEFDYLVESTPIELPAAFAETPEDQVEPSQVCAALMAELVDDGDTLMFGGGAMPIRCTPYLEGKHDLGCHTEVMVPLDLMQKGVLNNKRRNLCPGKVSCTACAGLTPEDNAYIDGNPLFDIRDMELNNHPLYVAQNENMVAINAPLEITIWGEINIERVGMRWFRGTGGQAEMLMGALLAKNGRSIHGTVSRKFSVSKQEYVSSIVTQFTYPGVATIGRHLADFVVTEYGVASLMGKTERERANELIAIAHPDFRAELRKEARQLFYA